LNWSQCLRGGQIAYGEASHNLDMTKKRIPGGHVGLEKNQKTNIFYHWRMKKTGREKNTMGGKLMWDAGKAGRALPGRSTGLVRKEKRNFGQKGPHVFRRERETWEKSLRERGPLVRGIRKNEVGSARLEFMWEGGRRLLRIDGKPNLLWNRDKISEVGGRKRRVRGVKLLVIAAWKSA